MIRQVALKASPVEHLYKDTDIENSAREYHSHPKFSWMPLSQERV
jgi:hypothetical protein